MRVETRFPAITLWQPWASLIADGYKTFETRSWSASPHIVGQRIAIHAAARPTRYDDIWHFRAELWHYNRLLLPTNSLLTRHIREELPHGAIVAIARLVKCVEMPWPQFYAEVGSDLAQRIRKDARYGDFTAGRYAWFLEDIQKLDEPIPATGARGFWMVDLPVLQSDPNT